ncbi:uncharacterized protein L201_004217 [Kwoniella dendrophila CBS 6074]|uniref:Palmitoyltransferase n=1 Tax=Kwoniella dendrophila CBS 6074 TaxID=1295534 RepID=A0AAX4JV18_9TREE
MILEKNENDEAHELMTSPQSLNQGLSLPTRSASVKSFQNDHEAGTGTSVPNGSQHQNGESSLVRKDSLEDTKSFYGVNRPTSPPSSSTGRPSSALSKNTQTDQNSRIRSSSINSNSSSVISPTSRGNIPLPTPKGFLSPKKPNLALRLEKRKERNKNYLSFSSSRSPNPNIQENEEYSMDNDNNNHNDNIELISSNRSTSSPLGQVEEEERVPDTFAGTALKLSELENNSGDNHYQQHQENKRQSKKKPSDLSISLNDTIPNNNLNQGWDRSIGRSVTEMSTPPRTAESELSSDELVNRQERERNQSDDQNAGRIMDLEKGQIEINRISPKSRKSWNPKSKSRSTSPTKYNNNDNDSNVHGRRKYVTYENDNPLTSFWWNGRLITGGDHWYSMIFVIVILLGISGVWIGTTGVWLWVHGREYGLVKGGGIAINIIFVYLFGITSSSLIASAFRDPGIIPRKLDPDPPTHQTEDYWEAWPRELTVNNGKITVKYCETCQSYRPPRSSHCRLCGNCVDGIDHHCSYLHSCVGKRNYFSFLVLLVSATIADIYIIVFSAIHFSLLCHHDHISFGKALSESPGAAVSFLLGVFLTFPILFLSWYHCRLLLYNLTTVEQIRANTSNSLFVTSNRPDNPFASNSLFDNVILASIGRPQFPSWIDANGFEETDKREVNPALINLNWVREREGIQGAF